MRKLREWMNRKKRAKHFKMYQLEPVSHVIRIQPDIQVISGAREEKAHTSAATLSEQITQYEGFSRV